MSSTASRWRAGAAGVITGAAAGLVGVGGGEFRIPVLIRWLRLPLRSASAANLLIGLCTVFVSVARRYGQTTWQHDDLVLVAVMSGASLFGGIIGVLSRGRLAHRSLLLVVKVYLILIGTWMVYEALSHTEHALIDPHGAVRLILAGVVALLIAIASGVLGVAGGEMRIPALLYLFAVPIKAAGTLSLLASIPTVAAGAFTDWRLGQLKGAVLNVALVMGGASVIGVLVGAAFVPAVGRDLLKGLLGAILLLASVRLTAPVEAEELGR